ncbi:uncharacterized protein TRIADDRAFT_58473 [Trichoplax adhaerens]|uniref:Spermatogenesis-associated protein 24 n=1 Tax=Trichoplax adhaerens TaxID=10228 RepID=B3S2T4_TRIAD|nr:hypothetical protein TRIADDRAFT_58473 [Trichoplax adhaerens]EDV22675.1 hypothetical protein TRIADDRAFT_58473 [Trichoplax adhaerens]|eukprot:XP_002114541.1 hypothetical protein TRIADDRAFT_58473 [Trichoplax adhaerens]
MDDYGIFYPNSKSLQQLQVPTNRMARTKPFKIVSFQIMDACGICQKILTKKAKQNEEVEHAKTKSLLAKESEKLDFALGEINILNKQLQREKDAFEEAFGDVQEKAAQEFATADQLKSKCSEMAIVCNRQEDSIGAKEIKIRELKARLAKQREAHRLQLSEMAIKMQQEVYMSKRSLQGGTTFHGSENH